MPDCRDYLYPLNRCQGRWCLKREFRNFLTWADCLTNLKRKSRKLTVPPMWPGFDSPTRRQMWVEFVVGSRPCSERFFSGYSGFPLSSKTNISKFQLTLKSPERDEPIKYVFIYLFIYPSLPPKVLTSRSGLIWAQILSYQIKPFRQQFKIWHF